MTGPNDKLMVTRRPSFEETALSRQEYISALVHFYRGELARSNVWRTRLDTTTNWSIISVMGLMSFTFSNPAHSHGTIVLGVFITLQFLTLEARRYRFFDVWRNRVRMIEENFYGPILTRDLNSPTVHWGNLVAGDLIHPRFKITSLQAFRARLKRNYWFLFVILLMAWLIKTHTAPDIDLAVWYQSMAIEPVPPWLVLAVMGGCYLFLTSVILFVPNVEPPELSYWTSGSPFNPSADL